MWPRFINLFPHFNLVTSWPRFTVNEGTNKKKQINKTWPQIVKFLIHGHNIFFFCSNNTKQDFWGDL